MNKKDLSKGLVAYWSFNSGEGDIVFDNTQHHHDGILHNAVWVKGKRGFALQFNGKDGVVGVPHSESLIPKDSISLVAWVKLIGNARNYHGIIGKNGYSSGYRLLIHDESKKVLFQLTGKKGYNLRSSERISMNKWYFIVATYDGSKMKLYVDGNKDPNEQPREPPIDRNNSGVALGKPYFALNGLLDEVRIYNRALSEQEINKLYHLHM